MVLEQNQHFSRRTAVNSSRARESENSNKSQNAADRRGHGAHGGWSLTYWSVHGANTIRTQSLMLAR